jgi:spore coat protein U-like protein
MQLLAGSMAATRSLAGLASALAAGAALMFAPHAHANEIDGLRDLNLQVYGHLDQHCLLGSIDDADFGDLTRPGKRAESHIALNCNVPISVKISAAHGALANERHPEGQGPFAGSVDYSLEVRVPVRRPAHDMMVRNFESRDLAGAGQSFNTGDGIAVDGMNLRVALEPVTNQAGLLAGRYSETIEITVTPS